MIKSILEFTVFVATLVAIYYLLIIICVMSDRCYNSII
jgi:hypothetical protein